MIGLNFSIKGTNPLHIILGMSLMIAFTFVFTSVVSAHGYVESPESRSLLCKEGANSNCGGIEYEPQSVEGPGDYPLEGVADGTIAGGGGWDALNEQTSDRWAKVGMSSGQNDFTWNITARHSTRDWVYYITKNDWDENSPLERADFEEFCRVYDGGKRPEASVTHTCDIPERDGYHVILAYWEVADTANAFYQVIDANFDGEYIPPVEGGDDGDDGDDNEGGDKDADAYNASKVYLGGDEVTHNGNVYRALWWTLDQEPGTNAVWVLVSEGDDNGGDDGDGNEGEGNGDGNEGEGNGDGDGNEGDADAYDASTVYVGGDVVTYNGSTYTAAWWTLGEEPGSAQVWVLQ